METEAAQPTGPRPGQGDQEEPQEVQRPVQRQGQDEAEQGQQGARKCFLLILKNIYKKNTFRTAY